MASGVAIEIATLGGYTLAFGFHEAAGLGLMTSGCATAMYHAQDMSLPRSFNISSAEKKHTPDQIEFFHYLLTLRWTPMSRPKKCFS